MTDDNVYRKSWRTLNITDRYARKKNSRNTRTQFGRIEEEEEYELCACC